MRSRNATVAAALALALGAAACTPPAPAPVPVVAQVTSVSASQAGALLQKVSAREAQIHTLRATFSATVVHAGERRSVTGVVAVAKPDRLRFRLMLPFGMTVFDAVRNGADIWTLTPLGTPPTQLDLDALQRAFLVPPFDAASCQIGAVSDGLLQTQCGERRMAIRISGATIAVEWFSDETTVRYDDERLMDGMLLPFHIALTYPGDTAVDVTVSRYEINPKLGDELFTPPPGAEHRTGSP